MSKKSFFLKIGNSRPLLMTKKCILLGKKRNTKELTATSKTKKPKDSVSLFLVNNVDLLKYEIRNDQ